MAPLDHTLPINKDTHQTGFLAGESKMAALVNAMDWSKTPLGPIEQWPQSLRTTVSLCLASNFPISIAWGPHRVQIYNDGYWPICGDMHPASMGQDFKECWRSAWPVIGEAFEQASLGQTRFLENQRIFLDRFGYLEETFFTFSFSPILDESGGVGGLFHPVTEFTQQTLAERRLDILRTVAERTVEAKTVETTSALILETIRQFQLDLPFLLLYSLADDAKQAVLAGSVGLEAATVTAPLVIPLEESPVPGWPLAEVVQSGQAVQVDALEKIFGPFTSGPYPEPPHSALVFPLYLNGSAFPTFLLVAGISARRVLDEKYRLFYDLLAAAISSALSKAEAYQEERKRADALAELDRAKTAFFSNISHEFRTPLTLMLGPLEDSLADSTHSLPAPQLERLALVQRNALRLQRLVTSLLDFSRIESGRLQARFQLTDLGAYTGELASVFRSAFEKAGLAFTIDCQTPGASVFVDPEMWEKIVFNLLSNALKFTFEGEVALRLREESDGVVLKVSDTGEGIPPAELGSLFNRFYRVAGTRSRTHEGSGIGLAFVQELVRLHGGSIGADSALGRGTTFTVRLPTGSDHLPQEQVMPVDPATRISQSAVFLQESMQWLSGEATVAADGELTDAAGTRDPVTILVVDDNADMRAYVTRILHQNPQWQTRSAADGLLALEAVRKQKPDLILSDVMMPRLDGFGLLKALKEHPGTASIPVILLSARAGEEATLEGLQKGADDYLIKPFSARELRARVRTQLEITRTRQDNTLLREAEEELKKFKVISDHAFDAFILMREDGSFAYLNDLALKRWGYTRQEALGIRVPDVDPIYQEAKFQEAFDQAQRHGALPPFETLHQRKDGTIYPVEVSMGGISLQGKPHMFAIARDITQQTEARRQLVEREMEARAMVAELAAANEETRSNLEELIQANEQLLRTNTDLDNFIYTASHDLKAPISNIEGMMTGLKRHLPADSLQNEFVQKLLSHIEASIVRFKKTIGALTTITQLQRENNREATQISLLEVVEDIRMDLESYLIETNARVEIDVSACPTIHFSEKNLRSIVYNLFSNALKYRSSQRTPWIGIHCSSSSDYTILTVRDNGLGMDLSKNTKIFTMFGRLHAHVEGSGIGLYMVKKIVENAGGRIEVESQVDIGSTFRVYLPFSTK